MAFDPTKPVQTRDGGNALIICTDRKGDYPIVALIDSEVDGPESTASYTREGFYYLGNKVYNIDLVNIRVKRPHAELIIAWANGADIEFYDEDQKTWIGKEYPSFYEDRQYRIKE